MTTSNFSRIYWKAKAAGRDSFFADGQVWDMEVLSKVKCSPKSVPAHVRASIESRPQAKATKPAPKPASVNPYRALAKATPSQFRKEVEALMETAGCDRMTATRLLSQAAGLTKERESGDYFTRYKEQYKRR